MGEELIQRSLVEHGLKLGNYEFYHVPNSNLNQLKLYSIIPNKNYGKYKLRRPDALLVDRRNKKKVMVLLSIEYKTPEEFKSDENKKDAIRQCNTICQLIGAELGIATDNTTFIWFNPAQSDPENDYVDEFGKIRSYRVILNADGSPYNKDFYVDQQTDEEKIENLKDRTKKSIASVEFLKKHVSATQSQIQKKLVTDPTSLAKKVWQDVWSVEGASPERCLYTFLELFIFKYLSDLQFLTEDGMGNKVNFEDIIALPPEKAFKNYSSIVRPYMKQLFPESPEDHTTIINGTVLNPNVPEHSKVFHKILRKFKEFGELTNVDPAFKSKVFEAYMKEDIGKKNWGRYFTPRKIVDAMVEMSDIDQLPDNSMICDPACGVGGFVLEPIKVKNNGLNYYYTVKGNDIKPRYNFIGFDKGFDKEEQLTVILAKSNMLIFLSDLLSNNKSMNEKFADLMNKTFKLQTNTILGTLSKTEKDKYDLIMTNPPYVTNGSSNYKDAIKNDYRLKNFYKVNGMGIESLFLEWIVRSLKPQRKALVIVPDGLLNRLNDNKVREMVKEECIIEAIISLPVNTFFTTPKKTYILVLTKKLKTEGESQQNAQDTPVFTYLVSNIGETLDSKRFETPDKNDLPEMVNLYNQFKGSKKSFQSPSPRCKIVSIDKFNPDSHWSVDRWWSKDEKIKLGIEEENKLLSVEDFYEEVKEFQHSLENIIKTLGEIGNE